VWQDERMEQFIESLPPALKLKVTQYINDQDGGTVALTAGCH